MASEPWASNPAAEHSFVRATTKISIGHILSVAAALNALPDETAVDGEIVALDEEAKPTFNLLQKA